MASIDIGFIVFKTCARELVDSALFSLGQQDLTDVSRVIILNNGAFPEHVLADFDRWVEVTYRSRFPQLEVHHYLSNPSHTHSWSTNKFVREHAVAPWIFFTRADYLLSPRCLKEFRACRDRQVPGWPGFITSWCHQMGCDAELSNRDVIADYSQPGATWRVHPEGADSLVGQVPANYFQTSNQDAGVWLAAREPLLQAGGLDETLVSWGYQQNLWQQKLVRNGVQILQIEEYLFHHQHHAADRDFRRAAMEAARAR